MIEDILSLIHERKSVKTRFDPQRPIARGDVSRILEAGRWAPTAHNMQNYEFVVVDDRRLIEEIANIDYRISDAFIKENYANLSLSVEEWQQKKVGILGTSFPPAMREPGANVDEATRRELLSRMKAVIAATAVMMIMVYDPQRRAPASEGDFLGIISLGCVVENMWLMANALDIDFHVVSLLGTEPADEEVRRILRIPDFFKVVFGMRLGHAVSSPEKRVTVRRNIEDFTHCNRFGDRYEK